MAAITTINSTTVQTKRVRTATAQATVGQTDWVAVPPWAQYMIVIFNITAVAGTTPILVPSVKIVDPIALDNAAAALGDLGGFAITNAATTSQSVYFLNYGPGITGIANATAALAASGASHVFVNCILPPIVGIVALNDRTTGDETYTYTIDIVFRGGAS